MFKNINESFDKAFKHLAESKPLNEDPIPFTLSSDELNDPKEVDFKKIMKRNADADAKAKAEKERQDRIAASKEKYKDVLNGIESMSTDDAIESLHTALVPPQGIAETVAGELVRATMRILYRDYNDGDKFFMGYGLETCGGSAQYLMDMGINEALKEILGEAWRYADNDDAYTTAITSMAKEVINHIATNPDLLAEPNKTDSRDYDYSKIEENQPTWDYDFLLPYDVTKYIDAGYISERDVENILDSNLSNIGIHYSSVDCSSDQAYINGLDYDSYEAVEGSKMWEDAYWEYEISEWETEYGDPDEEDDLDESKSIKESRPDKEVDTSNGKVSIKYGNSRKECDTCKTTKVSSKQLKDYKDNYSCVKVIEESKCLKESPVYDLVPTYDSRQSFYNKARVDIKGDEQTLYSYNTPVAKIVGGKVELLPKWDYSSTTLRHIKEFLKQNGFEATSLSQIRNTYL
jgi:hypothetical protein